MGLDNNELEILKDLAPRNQTLLGQLRAAPSQLKPFLNSQSQRSRRFWFSERAERVGTVKQQMDSTFNANILIK